MKKIIQKLINRINLYLFGRGIDASTNDGITFKTDVVKSLSDLNVNFSHENCGIDLVKTYQANLHSYACGAAVIVTDLKKGGLTKSECEQIIKGFLDDYSDSFTAQIKSQYSEDSEHDA